MPIIFPSEYLTIDSWRAFKGCFPPGSPEEHRIIIVYNCNGLIKYFYVTSQVEKAKALNKYDICSLVSDIDHNDWDVLTKLSCIQCNKLHLHDTTKEELQKAYEEQSLQVLGEVPENIKSKIKTAICYSKSFTDSEKQEYSSD